MNKPSIFHAFLGVTLFLAPAMSHARWMNPNTGRFWTMDSYEGVQEDPKSLHKYTYGEGDPVNNVDPSGNEIESLLSVISISSILFAQISPAAAQATRAATPLPALPTSIDGQLLVGLIFGESSSRNFGGGENEDEKIEMGLTVLNRTYYSTLRAPNNRNYNTRFGDGTVLGALRVNGEFVAHGGNRWKAVMIGNSLKPKAELDKLQVFEKDHLRLSIEAADFCLDGRAPLPTGLAGIGNPPGQFPVAFNKANNSAPSPRMVRFLHAGSHTFYSFITGREAQ